MPSAAFAQTASGVPQPVRILAETIAEVQVLLGPVKEKAAQGADTSAELQQLAIKAQTLQGALGEFQGQLDTTAQKLQALVQEGKVSGEVLTRFEAFRTDFRHATAEALNGLASLQTPSSEPLGQRAETARAAVEALKAAQPLTITHSDLEPTKLPHRKSDIPHREPEEKPAMIPGQAPPGPADLAPTLDAQITLEIQALAAQKNFDPVDLFAFVRNTIEFEPYFGSLKGSQGTLLEKAGNDMDQASLLIALFRASNIPARYVAGVAELPIEKVMNWVGVETAEAAVAAFARNGIPSQPRQSEEGRITHLIFFHVIVEAFLPEDSGRRASRQPRWVLLDPSFKLHEFAAGIDLTAATGFDANAFLQGVTSGATINQTGSFFTNLNEPFVGQELTRLTNNLLAFVQDEIGPNATVGDVLGTKQIKPLERRKLRELAEAFPFKTFTPQQEFAELPQGFRHLVDFAMFGFSNLFALPELVGKRVTVTYVAATPQDQALIDAFGGILNVFPAFLVNLKPRLQVEGQVVAEGEGVPLGSSQILRTAFRRPLETAFDITDKIVTTGALYAVILDLQRMPIELSRARIAKLKQELAISSTSRDEIRLESIHAAGAYYFAVTDLLSDIQAAISRVIVTRESSVAVTSQDLSVLFLFGLPIFVRIAGLSIDVTRNIFNPISVSGDPAAERAWFLASGAIGSAEEHGIFEQLFDIPSVSTERLLQVANSRGVPVFTIDQSNLNQILPQLETFDIVKQRVREEVNVGRVAIVPKTNLRFFDFFGIGFIVADLSTGAAAYLLAGFVVTGGFAVTGGGGTAEAADIDAQTAQKEVLRGEKAGELAGNAFKFGGLLIELGLVGIAGAAVAGSLPIAIAGGVVVVVGIGLVAIGFVIIKGPIDEHNRQINESLGTP